MPKSASVADLPESTHDSAAESCPACGEITRKMASVSVGGNIPLYHCNACGLGALSISGSDNEGFDEYWTDVNQRIYSEPSVIAELTKKYEGYFSRVLKAVPNMRFLDVGSGAGISIGAAATLRFEATGIEPSASAVALSRDRFNLPVIEGLLEKDDALPRDYGALALWDVIEHVIDPRDLIEACHDHLARSGVLLLETPDEGTLLRGMLRFAGSLGIPALDLRRSIYYRAHRYYFTRAAMTALLTRCGFEQIRFYGEHTMFEKELLKKRLYGQSSPLKLMVLKTVFFVLKRLPFMANKMVVTAVKK